MDDRVDRRIGELLLTLEHMGYVIDPVSEADLIRLVGALGVQLPYDYREFLLRIGYNAGPYTMWSPDRILAELGRAKEDQESLPEDSGSLYELRMLLEESESIGDLRDYLGADDVEELQELWKVLSEYKRQYPAPPLPSQPFHFTRAQAEDSNHH